MAGNSNNGPVITALDGANSLIIQKLRGTASGDQMPQYGTPLEESIILTIESRIQMCRCFRVLCKFIKYKQMIKEYPLFNLLLFK